jgi:diguanylate cyclase (GGDEF)-like protein
MGGAMVLMAVMLVGMAGWTILGIVRHRDDLRSVSLQQSISDEYRRIVNQATRASYHYVRMKNDFRPEYLDQFGEAIAAALAAQDRIIARGSESDREALRSFNEQYGDLLLQGYEAIALLRAGAIDPASLPSEDSLDAVVRDLSSIANERRAEAEERYRQFESDMSFYLLLTLVLYAFGLPLVGAVFFAIRRIDHDEVMHRAELTRLSEAALTDALTGLGNHRAFQEELGREVSRAARDGRALSLAIIDIDDFKEVNDEHGHVRGDLVLSEFARLLAYLRAHDRAFRIGGDEFAIILAETPQAEAFAAMERLRSSVESSLELTTISIGLACTEVDGFDLDILKEHADAALYEAKGAGKNQVATYSAESPDGVLTTEKTHALRQMLDTNDIYTVFQPIYLVGSRQLVAFEALMRTPGDCPLTTPMEAFRAAERIGRSWQLDLLCFTTAAKSAAELPDGKQLFMNLNPRSLANKNFDASVLGGIVSDAGLPVSSVVIEITEQTSIPIRLLCDRIEELRAAGFRIALDDVGTGNNGLEILRTVRVDYVKIDRSVLVDAVRRGPGRAVLLAITAFAREAQAFVIAEGIDSMDMFRLINSEEVHIPDVAIQGIQGFLVGRPMESIPEALRSHASFEVAA